MYLTFELNFRVRQNRDSSMVVLVVRFTVMHHRDTRHMGMPHHLKIQMLIMEFTVPLVMVVINNRHSSDVLCDGEMIMTLKVTVCLLVSCDKWSLVYRHEV
nr:hypothetical protein [Tanacetum cinerariifolium]